MIKPVSSFFAFSLLGCIFLFFPWLHGIDLIWEQLSLAAVVAIVFGLAILLSPGYFTVNTQRVGLLLVVWLIYCALYLLPWPTSVITFISPKILTWYGLNHVEAQPYLTVYRQASTIEWVKFLTLGLLFASVWLLCTMRSRVTLLTQLIALGCAITAVYSLINFATEGAMEWISSIQPWDLAWKDGIRGTFSYKNQYALYIALAMALCIGLIIEGFRQKTPRPQLVLLAVTLLVLAITLINTSSRGVIVALVGGLAVSTAVYLLRKRDQLKRWLTPKTLSLSAAGFLVIFVAFTQSSVYERFTNQKLADNGRTLLRETAMAVITDHPVMGTGPGTYPYIQHVYKPMALGISKMSKRAHNDYLETVATTGIVGFVLLALPLGYMLVRVFSNVSTQLDGLLFGVRAAIIAFLIQSTYDTNTGIFFLPVLFITVLTLGFVIVERFDLHAPGTDTA